jgi:hypothetical protein
MPVRPLLPSPEQYQRFKAWLQAGVLEGRVKRDLLAQVGACL